MLHPLLLTVLLILAPPQASGPAAGDSLARANASLASQQWDQARTLFESVLQADPANADAQAGEVQASEKLALVARSRHAPQESLDDLLRAQRFAPNQPRLLFDLGVLEDEMHLLRDADTTLARLQQLQSQSSSTPDPQTLYAVARVKLDLQQLQPAEQSMRGYLAARPADASAHYGLGRILLMGQHPQAAQQEFARSVELQPQQVESYYQLGQIALDGGQYADALAQFSHALARNPHHGGALAGSGIAHFRQKQYDAALPLLQQAVTDAPDYQTAHYYLGLTLSRLGRKPEAAAELALAAKMADQQNQAEAQRPHLQQSEPK